MASALLVSSLVHAAASNKELEAQEGLTEVTRGDDRGMTLEEIVSGIQAGVAAQVDDGSELGHALRAVLEDVAAILGRQFDKEQVSQVTALVNDMFDRDWKEKASQQKKPERAFETYTRPSRKNLH